MLLPIATSQKRETVSIERRIGLGPVTTSSSRM